MSRGSDGGHGSSPGFPPIPDPEPLARAAFLAAPIPMLLFRLPDEVLVEVNAEFEAAFGLSRQALVGRAASRLPFWTAPGPRAQLFRDLAARGRVDRMEVALRPEPGGGSFTHLVSARAVDLGGVPHALVWGVDATSEREAEKALLAAERSLSEVLHSSPVGISISRVRDGLIVDMNEEFLRILGFARSEAVGRTSTEIGIWTAPDQRGAIIREFLEAGRCAPRPVEMRRKDGRAVTVMFSASALPAGEEPHMVAWVVDITDRLRAEEELRASEERWRSLAESAPVGILILGRDGTILSINRSLSGRSVDDVLGRAVQDLLLPAHRERGRAMLEAVFATGRREVEEFAIAGPDGDAFWVQASLAPLPPSGAPARAILVVTDINKRRRAEEALRESEVKWRSLVEHAPAVITIVDREGTVLSVNQTITGRPAAEVVGSSAFSFLPAESGARARELLDEVFRRGETVTFRLPVHGAGGELRWFEHRLAPVHGHGRVSSVICLSTDIHAQIAVESALRESEQRFRDIVRSLGEWVWEVDAEGRATYSSPQVQELLGFAAEEMLGKSPWDTCVPEERERVRAAEAEMRRHPRPFRERQVTHRHRDGRRVVLAVSGVPIFGPGGALRGYRGVAHDITDRLREEAEVHQARRVESLGVLAGGIAHDFNNLLTAILGNAELALAELPEGGARQLVAQIQGAGQHAAELTRQMLAYAGRGRLAAERVDLSGAVREMAQLLGASIPKKVELALDLAEGLPAVEADPAQLRQVVMNLVINAADAIGERAGRIAVRTVAGVPEDGFRPDLTLGRTEPGRGVVCVDVADSGPGIAGETLGKIFDPFYTTKFTGRGLGLAAVQGIVLRHGGSIAVSSTLGSGTTFRACFPTAAPVGGGAPAPPPDAGGEGAAPWRGSGTVLLVDDEEAVRRMAARMLGALGFEVLVAGDGREAVEVAAANPQVRVVLLDLTMPHMDGRETFRELRRRRTALPVVLCSGFDVLESPGRFAGMDFGGFLQKPYRLEDLRGVLRRALGE